MKKKQGFTLIELLAVIVILSIIALIAIPVIYDTIDKSKMGAFEQTLINVAKAANMYQSQVLMKENSIECRYFSFSDDVTEVTMKDGKTYYPLKELNMKGNLPTEGEIKVCDEDITLNAGDGSYSGVYADGETTVVKGGLADNDLQPPLIEIFNVTPKRDSIIVTVIAKSQSVGGTITNYYYKIDDEDYIKTTEPSCVFEGLELGQTYTITVMVENQSGVTSTDSKTVTTETFGKLTIDVENSDVWTSSKSVTIKEKSDEYKIEYKIRKYNEETKEIEESEFLEYTDSFTLDTMATTNYPILIIARYNDNGTYSDEKTYTVVNIDTTSPTNTKPVVNVSTTKPTSEASIVIRQDDAESGLDESTIEYGYSLDNVDYTWQASSELKKLKSGTKYYVKTKVTNNVGKTVESEATEYTPGKILTCSVSVPSGWATSKTVTITGTQTGVELQYQVGSTSESGWTTIDNEGTVTVEENTNVYCRLWDGTNSGSGTGIVEGIDREEPDLELKTEELTTNSVVIPYEATDTGSGTSTATCEYGTSTKYGNDGTVNSNNNACTISGLTSETTYYYRICVSDEVGNGPVCKEGNTKPASMESPKILFDNTPDNSVNGYYKEQTAQVTYITTGITNPRYFVKTDRTGTSNLTVINKCGNDTNPKIEECTGATGTTLTEGIWYEVNGNVNVTYDTAASENGLIYATIYDGTNFITTAPTGTLSKIDRTNPKLTLILLDTTTNSTHIGISSSDTETGISEVTCKYSDKDGSYTENGSIYSNNMTCAIIGLKPEVTYYYQICVSDGVGNGPVCEEGSTSTKSMPKPSITFTNTPESAVNGYLESQVAHVTYTKTGITSPRYFVKTTRQGTSSLTVTQSCGTGNSPATSCETITETTILAANTWYEVSGNLDVTYNEYSASTGTIYAAIYDGTNFIDPIPSGTLNKITKSVNYTVKHHQMNTDMTNYTLAETETLSGKVGYSVTPSVKTYTGFNSPSTKTVTVAADGSTTVDYYYTRKQVVVTFYRNTSTSDTTTATQTFTYGVSGQSFSDKGWSRTGYTHIGWTETATGKYIYQKTSGVSNNWINTHSPSIKLYAVWVKNPTVTFAHNLVNGYAKSSVATVTYSSEKVTNPVYYVRTTKTGTSSVAVTESCGTGNTPGTCTAITSTTALSANTWYKIIGNVNITYNKSTSSNAVITAYTYDGTTARAQGTGTGPKIDEISPTVTLGSVSVTGTTITIPYTLSDTESGIGSYTCKYVDESSATFVSNGISSAVEDYKHNAPIVSQTGCTLSGLTQNTRYYYQVCATDGVGNISTCVTDSAFTYPVKSVSDSETKYFKSLKDAINTAINSKVATTVTLLDNVSEYVTINNNAENDNVIVDFNSKTLNGTIVNFNTKSSLILKNGTISGGDDRAVYNDGPLTINNMHLKSSTTQFKEAILNNETGYIVMNDTNITSGTTYALNNSSTSQVNHINYHNSITGQIKGNVVMIAKTTTGVQYRVFGSAVTLCRAWSSASGSSASVEYTASSTTNSYGTYYYCNINKANHNNQTGNYGITVLNGSSLVIGTSFEMR